MSAMKFYRRDAYKMDSKNIYQYLYPNIDILTLREYQDNKYQDTKYSSYIFSRNKTFPLIKRYFNGLMMYSPCDMEFINKELSYDLNQCISPHMNHYRDASYSPKTVPCKKLQEYYPFIERNQENNFGKIVITEKLKLDNKIIHTVQYSRPNECTDKISIYPSDLVIF